MPMLFMKMINYNKCLCLYTHFDRFLRNTNKTGMIYTLVKISVLDIHRVYKILVTFKR